MTILWVCTRSRWVSRERRCTTLCTKVQHVEKNNEILIFYFLEMSEICGLLCLTFQKRWTTKKKTACYEMLSILFRRRQRVANQADKLFIHHGVIQSKLCATWIIFFPRQ